VLAQTDYPDLAAIVRMGGGGHFFRYFGNPGGSYSRTPVPGNFSGVHLDIDNESILTRWNNDLVSIDAAGTVTTLFQPPAAYPILHQSGNLLMTTGRGIGTISYVGLAVWTREGTVVRTFPTQIPFSAFSLWRARAVQDLDSGDYFVLADQYSQPPMIHRVREDGAFQNVTPPNWFSEPPDQDPRTGDWYAHAWFGSQPRPPKSNGIFWSRFQLTPPTQPVLLISEPSLQRPVRVHEGRFLFGFHLVQGNPIQESVFRLPLNGGPPTLIPVSPPDYAESVDGPIEIIGRRQIAGRGPATPGSDYELLVRFLREEGRAYQLAASAGVRPGITVAAGNIPLNPDALFLLSLTNPAVFVGFSGVLDATGRASARVRLPAVPGLRGFRMFFSGVTYGPGGIRRIAEPIGMTVQ
jgi:hypothetical protein